MSRDPFNQTILDWLFETDPRRPDIAKRRESMSLEFKENFNQSNNALVQYGRTLAAFSNRSGGYILFGIKNQPHRLIGMTNDNFLKFDPNTLSQFLNNNFSPSINWTHHVCHIGEKPFGVIFACESTVKPVVCTRTNGELRDGDIYYRYSGETRRIASGDLHNLINQRIDEERRHWRSLLERTARISPNATYLLDINEGRATGDKRSFVISKELLEKINFIHSGRFTENGEPTLRILGDVEVVRTEAVPEALQEVPIDPSKYCTLWEQDVVEKLREKIGIEVPFDDGNLRTLNGYHVRCIRIAHGIESPSKMYYRPSIQGARPLYGEEFIEWIVEEHSKDDLFIYKAVQTYKLNGN